MNSYNPTVGSEQSDIFWHGKIGKLKELNKNFVKRIDILQEYENMNFDGVHL